MTGTFTWRLKYIYDYLVQFFSECEIFVNNIKTHNSYSTTFFRKLSRLCDNVEKSQTCSSWQYNMAHALCMPNNQCYKHEPRICNIGCPTTYQTRHFFNNSKTNEDIATKQTHTTDTLLFISHTTNVLLFKSRCNIFISFRIIKEMPGLVGSATPCIYCSSTATMVTQTPLNATWIRTLPVL
jgi:hypothetical protein